MFADAVAKVSGFAKPILFITRKYQSKTVNPGLATLFFVNDQGCAVTCRHVAQQILSATGINKKYWDFSAEAAEIKKGEPARYKKSMSLLEKKYGYNKNTVINVKCQFVDVPSPLEKFTVHTHPELDVAIIQFNNFNKLNYNSGDIYLLDNEAEVRPGKSLCRLGFPFPEFGGFWYNEARDDIEWNGNPNRVPFFPLDGIVTRHLGSEKNGIFGIEMSTPGLRGMSGGPLFDKDGRIFGMQFATHHLHLGFDIENKPLNINGETKIINNQPFLHVGQCIHISVIKKFLDEFKVPYKVR